MTIKAGQLDIAQQATSPNFDSRPDNEISLIVIHCISLPAGHYGSDYVRALFCNELDCRSHLDFEDLQGVRVSSHLLIHRTGEITQFVPFTRRAWHAGESEHQGRKNCNDFSVGIELEGIDTATFTDEQYKSLLEVCQEMLDCWTLDVADIVGHSEIAPGRKTDPGVGFDWNRLRSGLVHG
jgi:AmpD protein